MSLPAFFPQVKYVPKVDGTRQSIASVCFDAGTKCQAVGSWIDRPIIIEDGEKDLVFSEPGDWGAVKIIDGQRRSKQDKARWALGILAYVLFDGVARASIINESWSKLSFID